MLKTFLMILTAVVTANAVIYHDGENEAVVIDDTISFDPNDVDESVVTTLRPEGSCVATSGATGNCLPYAECYPYAELLVVDNYLGELMNSTEPCKEEPGTVCCPNYSYQRLPAKRPSILPQFPKPTGTTPTTTTPKTTPTTNTTEPEEKKKRNCGSYEIYTDDTVVGGRDAKKGEFPWAVALTNSGRQFCGGSLISKNFILTAAHCVQQLRDASGIRVVLGGHNLGSTERGRESRTVSRILYHRDFSMNHLRNDIALLKLSTPVEFTPSIQPICLNTEELTFTEKVELAGWGKTGNNGYPSKILKTVRMSLISPADCRRRYQGTNAPSMTKGMICAGETSPLKDACNGDSGGPLTLKDGDAARQVGVVSWGIGCGEKPGVYTLVSEYLPWITKNSK